MFYKIPHGIFLCYNTRGSDFMYSLFLDTHDKNIIFCLYKDNQILEIVIKESLYQHTDFIMNILNDLMNKNSITVHDLNEIIVVNGPGSFTGVRIGVTIAKMLAYTLNIKIKTITSLDLYAISSVDINNKLVLIRDIKGAYGAVYNKENDIVKAYFYLNNSELDKFIEMGNYTIVENIDLDFEKIYEYTKNIDFINPHSVNPTYIKVIEALKND